MHFLVLTTFPRKSLTEISKSQVRKADDDLRYNRSHVYHICMCVRVCIYFFFFKKSHSLAEESSSGRTGCSFWYCGDKVSMGSKYMSIQQFSSP